MEKASVYLRKIWIEVIYYTINIIFMCSLNNFNKTLLSLYSEDDWRHILAYEEYKSLKYFIMTIILLIIGVLLCRNRFKMINEEDLELNDVLLYTVAILIIIFCIIALICFIDSPILRAVVSGLTALVFWIIINK